MKIFLASGEGRDYQDSKAGDFLDFLYARYGMAKPFWHAMIDIYNAVADRQPKDGDEIAALDLTGKPFYGPGEDPDIQSTADLEDLEPGLEWVQMTLPDYVRQMAGDDESPDELKECLEQTSIPKADQETLVKAAGF